MTAPAERASRRALNARKRISRRPSRLGSLAGGTVKPDRVHEEDAGFPALLRRVRQRADEAPGLPGTVHTLLTLDGHIPADVSLRALREEDLAALEALGLVGEAVTGANDAAQAVFPGELGLTAAGRAVLRAPGGEPLAGRHELVGTVIRLPWPATAVQRYQELLAEARNRAAEEMRRARAFLAAEGPEGREELLRILTDAALRTAPFILYQGERAYTNFRGRNNLPGKTLWPDHPDCALSSLKALPLELWSDHDALLVVCLTLLVRSCGYSRIEEANGTQLTLRNVGVLLERTRQSYHDVPGGTPVPSAADDSIAELDRLARALAERRRYVLGREKVYREIHGVLMHKIERIAAPVGAAARAREAALCARLREHLPLTGNRLDGMGVALDADPSWLTRPHGGFATGLESLVYEVVGGLVLTFDADFAMSRGIRSLPRLIDALRAEDWERIASWGITEFFCCVMASPAAHRHFAGSADQVADAAWAMSSRMQYNSWHFIAGNLPKTAEVEARDHFVPPGVPDISFHSDQHHHGHVANQVRFALRSPQPVTVLDRVFGGFIDIRLLRCEGPAFTEQDLLAVDRASALLARATTLVATAVARGEAMEVTAFDSEWHQTHAHAPA